MKKSSLNGVSARVIWMAWVAVLSTSSLVAISAQIPAAGNSQDAGADANRLRGNPKAPVTIVEFSDFQCPYCQRVELKLKELLTKYDGQVSLEYRDYPLSFHADAELAAEASRCAAEQGKFWEYHDLLLANPSMLKESGLIQLAQKLGLDDNLFTSCLTSRKFRSQVQSDYIDGQKAGVNGTPAFFINGIYLDGDRPIAEFSRIIERELDKVRAKSSPSNELPSPNEPNSNQTQ